MKNRPLLHIALALSWLTVVSCAEETTAPNTAPTSAGPDLAVTSNTWVTKADMWSVDRWDLTTATVPNAAGQSVVYAIGGQTDPVRTFGVPLGKVMAYNVATNAWTLKASLPVPLWGMNPAAVVNGKIYVSGGCRYASNGSNWAESGCYTDGYDASLFMYDPATNTWTRKRDMPEWGGTGVTGVINGMIYVVTTCFEEQPMEYVFVDCLNVEGGEPPTSKFFRYNPTTDRWVRLARPHRMYHLGGEIYDKLYVTDGQNVEVYDPATNQWTTKRQGPRVRLGAAAAVLGAKLYLVGGVGFSEELGWQDTLRTVSVYHPLSDTWTTAAQLPAPRTGVSATRVYLNGRARIEVVGGSRPNNLQYIP